MSKIKTLLAFVALTLCGGAWAAPTVSAQWNGDFRSVPLKNGYSFALRGNTIANGEITITSKYGIQVLGNYTDKKGAILVKYRNLTVPASGTHTIAGATDSSMHFASIRQSAAGEAGLTGFIEQNGDAYALSASPTLPESGYLLFSYSCAAGIAIHAGESLASLAGGSNGSLHWSDPNLAALAVGGPQFELTTHNSWSGLVIEKVAVFAGQYYSGATVTDFADFTWAEPAATPLPNHKVIAINFNAGQGEGTGSGNNNNKLGDNVDAGIPGLTIRGAGWNQVTAKDQATATNLSVYDPLNGKAVSEATTPTATWSCHNHYTTRCGSSDKYCDGCANVIFGYLDDSAGTPITIDQIPFASYDVVVLMASDQANANYYFGSVKITLGDDTSGAKYYTYNNGTVAEGDTYWGIHHNNTIDYGKNAIRIPNLSGTKVKIEPHKLDSTRAGVAAVVIVDAAEVPADETTLILNSEATAEYDFAGTATDKTAIKIFGTKAMTLKNIASSDLAKINTADFTGDLVFEYTCTATSLTADDTLKNYIKTASGDKTFVFVGDATNGATIDYGDSDATSGGAAFSTHIVFRGGTHTFKYRHENATSVFGANAAATKPTILVESGTTLNAKLRNPCGWKPGAANTNGIIRVNDTATLNLESVGGTCYWMQQIYLEPGATMNYDGTVRELLVTGGTNKDACQIYVPDSAEGNTKVATIAAANAAANTFLNLIPESGATHGMGVFVGANSKLAVSLLVKGSTAFKKYGEGELQLANANTFTGGLTVEEGTVKANANSSSGNGAFGATTGTITIGANGTLDFANKTVSGGYTIVSNGGTLKQSVSGANANSEFIKSLTLNADTAFVNENNAVVGVGYASSASTLALGTYKLTVTNTSANFYLRNTNVTGSGTIEMVAGNLLVYGAESVASEATLKLGAGATFEGGQNFAVKNLEWCGNTVTVANGKTLTVSATTTANIADGTKTLPFLLSGTSFVKTGAGTVAVASDKLANFTGTISVQEGAIDFGAARPTQSLTFAEGTKLYLKSNAADEGVATVSHVSGNPTVYLNGVETAATITDGVLTIPYEIVVSGEACLYDWTFKQDSLASVGQYKNSLTWDTGYKDGQANAGTRILEDADKFKYGKALNTKATPYAEFDVVYPAEWTCMVAGIMPEVNNGALIAFGTTGGGCLALVSTGATEVKLVRTTGNSAYTVIGDPMEVPNARTASHAYTFVKTPTLITVYLDGKFWTSAAVSNPTFGARIQVGSLHGGKGDTNIESSKTATNATSIQAVRIMEGAAAEKTAKKFAAEFPYVSPSGEYTRTFTADANQLWSDESNKWDSSKKATEPDGVAVPVQGIVTAMFQGETTVKMNVGETYSYETLTIDGTGPVTFVKGDAEKQVKSAETVVKTAVVVGEKSLDLTGGQTKVEEGGSLTFDFTGLTAAGIASDYPFSQRVTGVIDEDPSIGTERAKIKVKKSDSLDPRISLDLVYDSVGKFYKVVATVTDGEVFATSNTFDTFVLSDGTTPTGFFPNDTVCIKYGIYYDTTDNSYRWQIPLNAGNLANATKIKIDYSEASNKGATIKDVIPANKEITIVSSTELYLRGRVGEIDQTIESGVKFKGDGTLSLNVPVFVSGAVEILSKLTVGTSGAFTLNDNATLKVPAELASGKVLSGIDTKVVVFDSETKTYSLAAPEASVTIDGVTTKYATLSAALADAATAATAGGTPVDVVMLGHVTTGANIPANVVVVSSSGAKLTGALTGTGTIKLEQAETSSQGNLGDFFSAGALTSFQGTVWLAKGRFRHGAALESQVKVKVTDGAQLYMAGGTWQNKISLSGNGYGTETENIGRSALRFEGDVSFDATEAQITIEDAVASICVNNSQKTIACKIVAANGARFYTRYGVDSITLTGDLTEVSAITKLGDQGGALVVPATYAGPISLQVGTVNSTVSTLNVTTPADGKTVKCAENAGEPVTYTYSLVNAVSLTIPSIANTTVTVSVDGVATTVVDNAVKAPIGSTVVVTWTPAVGYYPTTIAPVTIDAVAADSEVSTPSVTLKKLVPLHKDQVASTMTVTSEENVVTVDEKEYVLAGTTLKFTAAANAGYKMEVVIVNNNRVTADEGVYLIDVTEAMLEVAVSTVAIPAAQAGVSQNGARQPVITVTDLAAGATVQVVVQDGTATHTYNATADSKGQASVVVTDTLTDNKAYTYTATVGSGESAVTTTGGFYTGSSTDWMKADVTGETEVIAGGSWTAKPTIDAKKYVLDGSAKPRFAATAAAETTGGKIVVFNQTVTFTSAVEEEDLVSMAGTETTGAAGAITVANTSAGLRWMCLGRGAWHPFVGESGDVYPTSLPTTADLRFEYNPETKAIAYYVGGTLIGQGWAVEQGSTATPTCQGVTYIGSGELAKVVGTVEKKAETATLPAPAVGDPTVDPAFAIAVAGSGTNTPTQVAAVLATKPTGSDVTVAQAYALGATVDEAKAGFKLTVRGEDTNQPNTLKLVDGRTPRVGASGALVTRKVKTATTPDGLESAEATNPDSSDEEGVFIMLPTTGDKVKYFKLEYSFQ